MHVLIQCEDTQNRIDIKISRAIEEVKKLLVPSPEGEDELKKKQLMELAIINGTFRNAGGAAQTPNTQQQQLAAAAAAFAANNKAGFLRRHFNRIFLLFFLSLLIYYIKKFFLKFKKKHNLF